MTTTTKSVPGYLKPSEHEQPTARVIYEPPLSIGTLVRVKRFNTSVCIDPGETIVEIVGTDVDLITRGGQPQEIPYAYALWDTHEDPHVSDIGQLQEHCKAEGIKDVQAFLKTDAGKRWLTGGHKIGDRRCFEIGRGMFHSALIGGQWIPVVYETVRTQVKPVLGWALESATQTSYKGEEQASGHRGVARDAKGRLVRESNVERRRWSTTLAVEALAELDRISTETGEHRNEIVERLVLAAAPAPAAPAKGNSTNRAPDELSQVIEHACRKHGAKWPRTLTGEMVARYSVTRQAINSRKQKTLRRLEQLGAPMPGVVQ